MNKRIISLILSIVMILLIIPPASYSAQAASFESELRSKGFPESYIPSLLALHDKYPKWNFESLIVGENFSTSVSKERQINGHAQQLIQKYSGNDGKGYYCECSSCKKNGSYVIRENPNWVAASESAVTYYLDPRNFLNETYIFQFESTGYNSDHTQQGVEYILKGTFMYNANIVYKDASGKDVTYKNSSGNTVKYSKAIMEAAKYSNMSAYYLASKIKQEIGGQTASAVGASGTNSTYPGIYNFYNIQANTGGLDGLKWAATNPDRWVTNEKCRLRKGPSTSTEELVMLPANTQVTYISTTAKQADGYKWINVSVTYSGTLYNGYIREDLLTHYTTDAYNRPWTNPYLSIYNGAKWIADNFSTQFTGYLQKFNVNPASGSSMHAHEYMTNVRGAADEASHTYEAYKNLNLLSDSMLFVIPVFENMSVGNLATPGGITLSNTATGVKISWNSVSKAEKYRVFRKNAGGAWEPLGDTASTNYTDKNVTSGKSYSYTVCCVSADGKELTSAYDSTGKSTTYIGVPIISSLENVDGGIKITWGKVSGAEKYRVFYKNSSGSWTKIADTASTSYTYTDVKTGTGYTFTVRCVTSDGKDYTSAYDTAGKSTAYIAKPKLSAVENVATGVKITWNKATGAEKYRVFYKTASSGWTKIADTASTSYTWTGAKSGTNYAFTVRCVTSDGKSYTSAYDTTGKSIKYVAAPKISSVNADNNGTVIKWDKVSGAEKYRVYYKTASTGWTKIADTASTSYTWTGAKKDTKYTFTVRCITSDGKSYLSSYDSVGVGLSYLSAPKLTSATSGNTGAVISWEKVSGAENYRVYYKTASSGWTKITDTTSTSYTWTGAKGGTNYTFTVRCTTADGKTYMSGYDTTGKSLKYVAAPTISSVSNVETGVSITWGKVSGAENYRVYYKTGSGSWTKIADTTSTSYIWKGAKSGTDYTFTVRCITSDGKSYTSGYDTKGKSIKYVAAPTISSVSNVEKGVSISWGKVSGAEKYRVYYKTASSGWTKIADTTSASYTWTGAKSGTDYTFTVRCITSDGKSYTSAYDTKGKSIKYVAAPKISSLSSTADGVAISWDTVDGAVKYRVFYKTDSTGWTKITDTTSASYTWKGAKSGTKYTFTVRCISNDGKSYTSGYDSTGKSITV